MIDYQGDLQRSFLTALVLTLAIEIPILAIYLRLCKFQGITYRQISGAGLISSGLTLPYLWFVLPHYLAADYYFLLGEACVTAVESLILWFLLPLRFRDALVASVLSNSISAWLGGHVFAFLL